MHNKNLITLKVKSISQSFETFCTFPLEQMEEAYAKAAQMEQEGLEISLEIPGAVESLANSLGISSLDRALLEGSIEDEIHDHDDDVSDAK